jgi:hypothetical protein
MCGRRSQRRTFSELKKKRAMLAPVEPLKARLPRLQKETAVAAR